MPEQEDGAVTLAAANNCLTCQEKVQMAAAVGCWHNRNAVSAWFRAN